MDPSRSPSRLDVEKQLLGQSIEPSRSPDYPLEYMGDEEAPAANIGLDDPSLGGFFDTPNSEPARGISSKRTSPGRDSPPKKFRLGAYAVNDKGTEDGKAFNPDTPSSLATPPGEATSSFDIRQDVALGPRPRPSPIFIDFANPRPQLFAPTPTNWNSRSLDLPKHVFYGERPQTFQGTILPSIFGGK